MDNISYEQISMSKNLIENKVKLLKENVEVIISF